MTPQKAELLGKTVEFGQNCDTTTGRVKIPSLYAAPCVEPFTGKNPGATSPGVTADSIKVVAYVADPSKDPLLAATIRGAGADVGAQGVKDTMQGYFDGYSQLYELYGRKIDLEFFDATGASADTTAAKADAIAIASKKPFAVIGGPQQSTTVFADELAARGVLCVGTCATAVPNPILQDHAPYIWTDGPNPEQGALLAGEMISKIAPPGKAKFAGDPDLKNKKRGLRRRPLRHARRPVRGPLQDARLDAEEERHQREVGGVLLPRPQQAPGERPHDHHEVQERGRDHGDLHR